MVVETISTPSRRIADRWRRFLDWLHPMAPAEDMDGTGSFYRRRDEDRLRERDRDSSSGGGGIRIPPSFIVGLVMYLIGNTVGGIWWAATTQAKIDNLAADNTKLWQKIEAQEMIQNRLENNLDERIRGKIRETANDWGLFVSRK